MFRKNKLHIYMNAVVYVDVQFHQH